MLLWLPTAVRDPMGSPLAFTDNAHPKGVLHTTESTGWPTYRGGSIPPHATIRAKPGVGVEIRQHVPFSGAAFALRNEPGGVQTNRDFALQFELIGSADPDNWRRGYYSWSEADDVVLLALWSQVILPVSQAFSIPIEAPVFQPYPASAGPRGKSNLVRFEPATWDGYSGWCGHQHAPENSHGDPGAFPWDRMVAVGRAAGVVPDRPVTPPASRGHVRTSPAPLHTLRAPIRPGQQDPLVRVGFRRRRQGDVVALQQRLTAIGYHLAADGDYGPRTRAAVEVVQRAAGLTPDGVVGPLTCVPLRWAWDPR